MKDKIQKLEHELNLLRKKQDLLNSVKQSFLQDDGSLQEDSFSDLVKCNDENYKITIRVSKKTDSQLAREERVLAKAKRTKKKKKAGKTVTLCPPEVFEAFKKLKTKRKKIKGKKKEVVEALEKAVPGFSKAMWDDLKRLSKNKGYIKGEGQGAGTQWSIF